ncbi:hypothetical protein OV203_16465 [Nannocystis sp. ILAH1]|uniref:hypothetical protein n=1 Tax=Nannocystis sp. ILAH1 TaxID=2996789 RepID=UPI002271507E|nr:hypothetical protein [Nannocystis sp. ILAH1]MCY0988730.1 hypothetical protein [Nannocystis sp. ILAH1]
MLLGALAAHPALAEPDSDESDSPNSEEFMADVPAGSWGCIVDILAADDAAYCLAHCEGFAPDAARPAFRHKVRLGDVPEDWCAKKAGRYCQERGRELDYACWGAFFEW